MCHSCNYRLSTNLINKVDHKFSLKEGLKTVCECMLTFKHTSIVAA